MLSPWLADAIRAVEPGLVLDLAHYFSNLDSLRSLRTRPSV